MTEIGKAVLQFKAAIIFLNLLAVLKLNIISDSTTQPILLKRFLQTYQIKQAALASIIKPGRTTMHWQKTGQDQQTSAVVRYQLWLGLDLSD